MAPSRAGDAILRLASSPRATRMAIPIASFCCSHRAFTTTRSKREGRRDRAPQSSSVGDDFTALLDETLDHAKGTPAATSTRTSNFRTRDAWPDTGSRGIANELQRARSNDSDSISKMLASLAITKKTTRPSYSSADVHDTFGQQVDAPRVTNIRETEPVILPPNAGRLVEVDESRNMDVGRAFRTVDILCSKNKVKRSFQQQRFHERPGLKRKRLKNERWIKRFRENFKGTVKLVQKMKKQGW
ncbi:hypothetical protein BST61_g2888 [Cercospora zeina]